jgi:hypothetical protein
MFFRVLAATALLIQAHILLPQVSLAQRKGIDAMEMAKVMEIPGVQAAMAKVLPADVIDGIKKSNRTVAEKMALLSERINQKSGPDVTTLRALANAEYAKATGKQLDVFRVGVDLAPVAVAAENVKMRTGTEPAVEVGQGTLNITGNTGAKPVGAMTASEAVAILASKTNFTASMNAIEWVAANHPEILGPGLNAAECSRFQKGEAGKINAADVLALAALEAAKAPLHERVRAAARKIRQHTFGITNKALNALRAQIKNGVTSAVAEYKAIEEEVCKTTARVVQDCKYLVLGNVTPATCGI